MPIRSEIRQRSKAIDAMKNCRFKDKRLLVFYPFECAALTSYTIPCLFELITLLHALALQNATVSRLILHSIRCGFSFKSINYAETDFNHEMNNEVTNGTVQKNINQNFGIRFNHRSRAIKNSNKKIPEMNIVPWCMDSSNVSTFHPKKKNWFPFVDF